jgi:undecaprenyl-diphosphatase
MNLEVFRLINNMANHEAVLDKIMIFFSKDVPYFFMAAIAVAFIWGIASKNSVYRKAAFSTFLITVINLVVCFIIGSIYYVDRPFVHNKVNLLFPHAADASFPSDHAAGTMSIALGAGELSKPLSIVFVFLSLVVGFSRVYVGHHYPLDVIGGYAVVSAISFVYNAKFRIRIENFYVMAETKAFSLLKVRTYDASR